MTKFAIEIRGNNEVKIPDECCGKKKHEYISPNYLCGMYKTCNSKNWIDVRKRADGTIVVEFGKYD